MASKRKRAKKKQISLKFLFILIPVTLLLIAIVVAGLIIFKKKAPTNVATDLEYYYKLSADPDHGITAASPDELAIVFEDKILDERAFEDNGCIYISFDLVNGSIDDRFYYDSNEQLLLVTNAVSEISASLDQKGYTEDGEEKSTDYVIIQEHDGGMYVALDFVSMYSNAVYEVYQDPARVVITYKIGEKTYCDSTKETQIRVLGGVKSEVVGTVAADSKLLVVDDLDDWLRVVSEEGWVGYVQTSAVTDKYTEDVAANYDEPEYTSMKMDGEVKLGWASIYSYDSNYVYDDYQDTVGDRMNVYCPSWYLMASAEGDVTIVSDSDYVAEAHDDGHLVWALFSDESYDYAEPVLTHTSLRKKVIETVVADVLECGIDGINVDFEHINSDYGDDFLQFLREMSIQCRNNGLYFSVDNYAPYDYNACYHIEEQGTLCDYVMIMAYDDYLGTGVVGPNSSLPFVKEVMELSASKVDSSKLVVGLPFYSRIWTTDEDGTIDRREYSMENAWELLDLVDEDAQWDDELGLWYVQYVNYLDQTVDAWIEDTDTIKAKLEMLKGYGFAGYAFWMLGQEESEVWDVIAQY